MRHNLTVTALGIALAFGSSVAVAASSSWITQNGTSNTAVVEQIHNWNAESSINVLGNYNDTTVEQRNSTNVTGNISVTNWGYANDSVITTTNVNSAYAEITQAGSMGDATIEQGGYGFHNNLYAYIDQGWGWNNTAWVDQKGSSQDAGITQSGYGNLAGIEQRGLSTSFNSAYITQTGNGNDGFITQNGGNLQANLTQKGTSNTAVIDQAGYGHLSSVTQMGHGNDAYVLQR